MGSTNAGADALAKAVEERGYSCTANQEALREVLQAHDPVDEATAARLFAAMARYPDSSSSAPEHESLSASLSALSIGFRPEGRSVAGSGWNLEVVREVLGSGFDAERLALELDNPEFTLPTPRAFVVLMALWWGATSGKQFPLQTLIQRSWTNVAGQLELLKFATAAPPEVFSFESAQRQLPLAELLQGGKAPAGTPNQAWLSLDLLLLFSQLYDNGHAPAVHQILEVPKAQCPELLVLSTATALREWTAMARDACGGPLQALLMSEANGQAVLPAVWAACKEGVTHGLVLLYEQDPQNISRVLDVCQELKALPQVLDSSPYGFALELAVVASRREYLDLQQWLSDRFRQLALPFFQSTLKFIEVKLRAPTENGKPGKGALTMESKAVIIRVLQRFQANVPQELRSEVAVVTRLALTGHSGRFPEDIETEASDKYKEVYQGRLTVDGLVEQMKACRQGSPRDRQLFQAVLNVIYEEFQFLHNFPDKELQMTAQVLASLMVGDLLDAQDLRLMAVLMCGALATVPSQKHIAFITTALYACKDWMLHNPKFCEWLLQEEQPLKSLIPDSAAICEEALRNAGIAPHAEATAAAAALPTPSVVEVPSKPPPGPTPPPVEKMQNGVTSAEPKKKEHDEAGLANNPFPSTPPGMMGSGYAISALAADPNRAFQTINADTLEQASKTAEIQEPSQAVQDKVSFLVNNLTRDNLDAKAEELKKSLKPEMWPWFCNYMVIRRVAQEANHQNLYLQLADIVGDKALHGMLLETTFRNLRILLLSERLKTETSERSLLKNLGSWLGKLTLARNKPILFKDIDMKTILYDAYEQGKMIAVLPFINKVLEPCKDSKVFKPPNPWLQGILALVAEIYSQDKLKLNLKFEIEMMFRNLNLQIGDAKPSSSLAKHKRQIINNADFTADKPMPPPQQAVVPEKQVAAAPGKPPTPGPPGRAGELPPGPPLEVPHNLQRIRTAVTPPQQLQEQAAPPHAPVPAAAAAAPKPDPGMLAAMHKYVNINPEEFPAALVERLQLQRLLPLAIDRAIFENLPALSERASSVACNTTAELILKDFAFESNEQRMRAAAHLMAGSLAGAYAMNQCREPMRGSLMTQLHTLLKPSLDPGVVDKAVMILTNDNLELACQVVEKTASEKALREVDERLQMAYQLRANARKAGQEYIDKAFMRGRFPSALPRTLTARNGQLTPQQQYVYDDFARIPRTAPKEAPSTVAKTGSNAGSIDTPHASFGNAAMASLQETAVQPSPEAFTEELANQLLEKYKLWQQQMSSLVKADPQAEYEQLPREHELLSVVSQIVEAADRREDAAKLLANNIFTQMFEVTNLRLHTGASVAALVLLRDSLCKSMPGELTRMWVNATDERKWHRGAVQALMKANLFSMPDVDTCLAKAVGAVPKQQSACEFACYIVSACMVREPILAPSDLLNTLDALSQLARTLPQAAAQQLQTLVEQARRPRPTLPPGPDAGDPPNLRTQVMALFEAFVRLLDEAPAERSHTQFVLQLRELELLKGDDLTERFFRNLTELAVTHCLNSERPAAAGLAPSGTPPQPQLNFVATDALVRLVVCLVTAHRGGLSLLHKVLRVVSGVLVRDAAVRGEALNGRPYYRIFLGLIAELAPAFPADPEADPARLSLIAMVAHVLEELQPQRVPGFAFPWLELISHRYLMPKLLLAPEQRGWPHFQRLMIALLSFLEPYLRNADLTEAIRMLYKGTLRVLLVLLHDFPEFLCEYHFELCNKVPPSCIQMRNLILSAFPRMMRLPDPFTPNLKVDLLPEIKVPPQFRPPTSELLPLGLAAEVDSYLATRQPVTFLTGLKQRLMLPEHEYINSGYGTKYNVELLNSLVFYVGIKALDQLSTKDGQQPVMHQQAADIFQKLASDLDTEGRYLFLNALANQLRFPNNHTHYFSCILLYLFDQNAKNDIVQEQLTRVLLERLIVNRPHPWGLLITFIELIKNPRYNFWGLQFTHCAPEIERLFNSVAASCMTAPPQGQTPDQPQPDQQQMHMPQAVGA